MTFGEQKISLSRKVGDPISTAGDDGNRFTDAMFGGWLNEGQIEVALKAPDETLWSLTVMVQGADVPTDVPVLRMLYITFENDDGDEKIASPVSPLRREDITDSLQVIVGTSDNPKFYIEEGEVKFYPEVDDTSHVRFYFIREPPQMTDDDNICTLPPQYHNAVVNYAAFLGLGASGQETRAGFYLGLFDRAMKSGRPFVRIPGVIKPLSLMGEVT